MVSRIVSVALALPLRRNFSYSVPAALPMPEPGSRVRVPFGERVLTVVETCRRQGKKAVDYLNACIEPWRLDRAPPSLLPDTS